MGASNSQLHFSALLKYIIAPIYNFPHCSHKGPSGSLQAERQASEHFHVLVQDPAAVARGWGEQGTLFKSAELCDAANGLV
jgi:hypothetical protein